MNPYIHRMIAVLTMLVSGLVLAGGFFLLLDPAVTAAATQGADCFVSLNNTNTTAFSSADSKAVRDGVAAAAGGDVVKIAGDCVGVAVTNGMTQTVYIDKSITLKGGYNPNNWAAGQQPSVFTSTLDAGLMGRVMVVTGTVQVTLDRLLIRGGSSYTDSTNGDGGGIYNLGALTINHSLFRENFAERSGGALVNDTNGLMPATVVISGSQFFFNAAQESGGALMDYGNMTVINSVFEYNETYEDYGGAIKTDGSSELTIIGSYFHENTAASDNGAIDVEGVLLVVHNSSFVDNFSGDNGGAIYAGGDSNWVSDSYFSGNRASNSGGAITVHGQLTVTSSIFFQNTAEKSGGGLFVGDDLLLIDSEVSLNSAGYSGGGLQVAYYADILNSTISDNTAGLGGGIALDSSFLTLTHVTISHNTAITALGGISTSLGSIATVKSSIIANSTGGADCGGLGLFLDNGYNLVEDSTCISAGTSLSGDPKLGPLADNGGDENTWTHALLAGSPAIDVIPFGINGCGSAIKTDQRRAVRPQDGACDIGAFELGELYGVIYLPIVVRSP